MIKLMDVSEWQGDIDYNEVKASGIEGVIIRAGYGKGNVDGRFASNMKRAIAADLKYIGVYWFSYAYTVDMARKEAEYCDQLIWQYAKDINLPIFFDWEYDSMEYAHKQGAYPGKTLISDMIDVFCEKIKELGYDAGYYCNWDYYNNYINHDLLSHKIWLADWDDETIDWCYVQQYTDKGRVNGVDGNVDLNYLIGTAPDTPEKDYQTVDDVVRGIWDGDFGNGEERKERLYDYFQNKVNEGRPD